MTEYFGIMNRNGVKNEFQIWLNIFSLEKYTTRAYIADQECKADVDHEKIIINGITYYYRVEQNEIELIIVGKEEAGILHWFFPCFFHQIFFVLTNNLV